jgi:hypothetical protein
VWRARRAAGHVDEHDRQLVSAKRVEQDAALLHDFLGRMSGGKREDAVLQIDDDQCGLRIERGDCHDGLL